MSGVRQTRFRREQASGGWEREERLEAVCRIAKHARRDGDVTFLVVCLVALAKHWRLTANDLVSIGVVQRKVDASRCVAVPVYGHRLKVPIGHHLSNRP